MLNDGLMAERAPASVPRSLIVNVADYANLMLLNLEPGFRRKLEQAEVVPSDAVPPEVVTMQSRILLRDLDTRARRVVTLVYPAEQDLATGSLSVLSALGAQLLGAWVGSAIECSVSGAMHRFEIEEIVYQPEQSMRTDIVVRTKGSTPSP